MSTPPRDSTASRAEARRRARLAARGELPEEEEAAAEAPADSARGGILSRLFPPAPELPNRPPALAGFDESGPLRPIRVRAFLLRRNLTAWLGTGFVAAVGYFGSIVYRQDVTGSVVGTVLPLVATFLMFGALIAAGWFGWQRPALFGTAAAIVSYILVVITIVVTSAMIGVTPDAFGEPGQVATSVIFQGIYQAALGFLGGWYGGYLRRRQTQLSTDRARQSRRR